MIEQLLLLKMSVLPIFQKIVQLLIQHILKEFELMLLLEMSAKPVLLLPVCCMTGEPHLNPLEETSLTSALDLH